MSREGLKQMHANLTRQSGRLKGYVRAWLPVLGLDSWSFTIDYHGQKREDDPATNACVSCSWEYMSGHIDFYLPNFEEHDDLKAEFIVVHELVHAIVNEMKPKERTDESAKHEEHCVTHLAKAFLQVRRVARTATEKAIAKQKPKPRKRSR